MSKALLNEQNQFSDEMNQLWYDTTDEKTIITSFLNKILEKRHFKTGIDIGAGPGLLSQPLYERCDDLTLLELLPIYREELSQKFPRANIAISSLQDYNYKNYDVILFSHVLYYIANDEWFETTKKFYDLLNPNGILIIATVNTRWIFDIFHKKLKDVIEIYSIENNQYIHSISSLGTLSLYPYTINTTFTSNEAVLDYLSMFFRLDKNYLNSHCEEEINQFQNKLIKTTSGYELKIDGHVIALSKN